MTKRYDSDMTHPVKSNSFSTEHAAAIIALLSLAFLILVRRGFRGVNLAK